jgi:hypothetical protein
MDELEKWAQDKPKFLVMFSVFFAMAADTLYSVMKNINKNLYGAGFKLLWRV